MKLIIKLILIIMIAIFIISFSLSFVIICRPFYYLHIDLLNITEKTNYIKEEIKEAYDDIIDYTTLNKKFSTGKLKYSKEGYNHFKDCKLLFTLNFILLGISSIVLIIKKKFFNKLKLHNHNLEYWSSLLIITIFSFIFITTLINGFEKSFEKFHHIFFQGKDNWLFDPTKDEIIRILPQQYFLDCALLILIIISIISISIIIKEKVNKRSQYE